MKQKFLKVNDVDILHYETDVAIIGSGAAGLACAVRLYDAGITDIIIITSGIFSGTSYNSGSDKQTYYKLSCVGDSKDSPYDMAQSLYAGGAMDGDTAYVESVNSLRAFYNLVEIGVPFPSNEFGAFVGYKTDHDPTQRGTSAGPRTSKYMVECLLNQVVKREIPILDQTTVVKLITAGDDRKVIGFVALSEKKLNDPDLGTIVISADSVVNAAGGPGELYERSVYPSGQVGMLGVAIEAGADAVNLGECQFGLASLDFKWNLSGSYQQVVPSYFSVSAGTKYCFLNDCFTDISSLSTNIFLKGYQWPFSAEKSENMGSSLVDLAVMREASEYHDIYIDYTVNPSHLGIEFNYDFLNQEAREYLARSGATQTTPYERLIHMNPESIEIFEEHGVSLQKPLRAAVCFQHVNGGLAADCAYRKNLPGLYAIGEAAGAHGVSRPGGAALNSGQVGAIRVADDCADSIRKKQSDRELNESIFIDAADCVLTQSKAMLNQIYRSHWNVRGEIQRMMSQYAGIVRYCNLIDSIEESSVFFESLSAENTADIPRAWETKHLQMTARSFLASISFYIGQGGGSRGSYLIVSDTEMDDDTGVVSSASGDILRFRHENLQHRKLRVRFKADDQKCQWDTVKTISSDDSWFETIWAEERLKSSN